jgi:hypothetical protein
VLKLQKSVRWTFHSLKQSTIHLYDKNQTKDYKVASQTNVGLNLAYQLEDAWIVQEDL